MSSSAPAFMEHARGEPIDAQELHRFCETYFEAWNLHSPEAVADCASAEVLWDSPALPEIGSGREAVVDIVRATDTAFPDYQFSRPSPLAIAEDRRTAYVPWRMTGTNTGPFEPPGYAPTGRPIDLSGLDVWRFKDRLIWRYQAIYNYSLLARQLGLAMPRGGKLEWLAVRTQRLLFGLRYRIQMPSGNT